MPIADEYNRRWHIVAVLNIISCRYPPWLSQAQRLAISLPSEVQSGYPSAILEQSWRALDKQFPDLKELVILMDLEEEVRFDELVVIRPGKGMLGQIVEKFEQGLKVATGQGFCKVLGVSFMRKAPTRAELEEDARELVSAEQSSSRQFRSRRKDGVRDPGVSDW